MGRPPSPELGLDLPTTAIGKDHIGPTTLLGATLARAEGLELSLLGLSVGIDVDDRRLRLPGVGLWPGTTDTTNAVPPSGTAPAPP